MSEHSRLLSSRYIFAEMQTLDATDHLSVVQNGTHKMFVDAFSGPIEKHLWGH